MYWDWQRTGFSHSRVPINSSWQIKPVRGQYLGANHLATFVVLSQVGITHVQSHLGTLSVHLCDKMAVIEMKMGRNILQRFQGLDLMQTDHVLILQQAHIIRLDRTIRHQGSHILLHLDQTLRLFLLATIQVGPFTIKFVNSPKVVRQQFRFKVLFSVVSNERYLVMFPNQL